jgi:prepilin-type N-terminal cleavage/methylation domain-containing protein
VGVRGFSLIETLTAITILGYALLALAPLVMTTRRVNSESRHLTAATLLALDKIEDLRSAAITAASPSDALDRNAPGFCDFFDALGTPLGGGGAVPIGTAFVRRWSIALPSLTPGAETTIRVSVIPQPAGASPRSGVRRYRGEVQLAAVIARGA